MPDDTTPRLGPALHRSPRRAAAMEHARARSAWRSSPASPASGRRGRPTWTTGPAGRLSDERIGVEDVFVTPDGEHVVWWHDATGDEKGRWLAAPVRRAASVRPLVPDVPDGWAMGIALAGDVVALGLSDDDGYAVYVTAGGEPARRVYLHDQPAGVGCEWPQGSRRPVVRRLARLRPPRRARRHPASRDAGPRRADRARRSATSRTTGRRLDPGGLVPGPRRPSAGVAAGARPVRTARDLGPRHRRAAGPRGPRPPRRRVPGRLVSGRRRRCSSATSTRASTSSAGSTWRPARPSPPPRTAGRCSRRPCGPTAAPGWSGTTRSIRRGVMDDEGGSPIPPPAERGAGRDAVPLVLVREPRGAAHPGVGGDAARRRPPPDHHLRARRPRVALPRRLRRGDPGLRRPRLRRRDGELPRAPPATASRSARRSWATSASPRARTCWRASTR